MLLTLEPLLLCSETVDFRQAPMMTALTIHWFLQGLLNADGQALGLILLMQTSKFWGIVFMEKCFQSNTEYAATHLKTLCVNTLYNYTALYMHISKA